MIFRRFDSAGTSEAMQNGENIYEITENLFREFFLVFFPLSNLTQINNVNFWTHVDRKFITSLFKKIYKWPLIFVSLYLVSY